jgi:hypothetical protein
MCVRISVVVELHLILRVVNNLKYNNNLLQVSWSFTSQSFRQSIIQGGIIVECLEENYQKRMELRTANLFVQNGSTVKRTRPQNHNAEEMVH